MHKIKTKTVMTIALVLLLEACSDQKTHIDDDPSIEPERKYDRDESDSGDYANYTVYDEKTCDLNYPIKVTYRVYLYGTWRHKFSWKWFEDKGCWMGLQNEDIQATLYFDSSNYDQTYVNEYNRDFRNERGEYIVENQDSVTEIHLVPYPKGVTKFSDGDDLLGVKYELRWKSDTSFLLFRLNPPDNAVRFRSDVLVAEFIHEIIE